MSATQYWSRCKPAERVFLAVWIVLLVQAPLVIGVVMVGAWLGWWKA